MVKFIKDPQDAQILSESGLTGISVQELINAFCDITDGETLDRNLTFIRDMVKHHWTNEDGSRVL